MSYELISASSPHSLAWMESYRLHLPRNTEDVASRPISSLFSFASLPLLALLGGVTTNQALNYIVQFDSGHTNPVISMPGENMADWLNVDDEEEFGGFLSFLDAQIETHPEWIEPADESQLNRLDNLLANVKV